jgi:putative FmdB family regulatory protein
MPIYAYKCASCGYAHDEMQKVSDVQLTVCPSCGKAEYAKQVAAPGFALKGNGWYATDFKGGNSKPAEAKPDAPSHACGTGACPACN